MENNTPNSRGHIHKWGGGELMKFIISNVVKLSFECKSKNLTKD